MCSFVHAVNVNLALQRCKPTFRGLWRSVVGRDSPRPPHHNAPVIEPVELGPVKAECDAFDVPCAVRIEANVTPTDTLVVRTRHAAALLALGLVLTTQRGIAEESGAIAAFGLLRRVDDGDFVLI